MHFKNKKATHKHTPHSSRRPLADFALMTAITVLVIYGLCSLLFGLTILGLVLMAMSIAYCVLSAKRDSHSPLVGNASKAYLILTVVLLAVSFYLDKPTQPKRTAFQHVDQTDTVAEEEYIVETPMPVEVDSNEVDEAEDSLVVSPTDTMRVDTVNE